jgi:hypothetical protein
LSPAFRNARQDVVGYEKLFGSRGRISTSRARLAARKPDVRSGIGRPVSHDATVLNTALPRARVRLWSLAERAPITMS